MGLLLLLLAAGAAGFRRRAIFTALSSPESDLISVTAESYYYHGEERHFAFFSVGGCVPSPDWPTCTSLPPGHLAGLNATGTWAALFGDGGQPPGYDGGHLTDPAWARYPPPPSGALAWALAPGRVNGTVRYSLTGSVWDVYNCRQSAGAPEVVMGREGNVYYFDVSLNFWVPHLAHTYSHSCSSTTVRLEVSPRTGAVIGLAVERVGERELGLLWAAAALVAIFAAVTPPATCGCRRDTQRT